MRRLVFIVEGDTEIILVEKLIMPYILNLGINIPMHVQTIVTNRKQHKKGGVSSYGKFRNEIERTLSQGNVIVTTFIDFFKIPTDFPNFTLDSKKIAEIENGILNDFESCPFLIPYIQSHEVEALMFSERTGFEFVIDDDQKLKEIDKIISDYPNPEEINNSPETAPSKRLSKIFNYDKVSDGELIFDTIKIESILEKCPRFNSWIETLLLKTKELSTF